MTGNPLELFRKFFGAVRAIFWLWGSFLAPDLEMKSVIAREFLQGIDTSLAVATSGLRTNLLLQEPPPFEKPPHSIFPDTCPAFRKYYLRTIVKPLWPRTPTTPKKHRMSKNRRKVDLKSAKVSLKKGYFGRFKCYILCLAMLVLNQRYFASEGGRRHRGFTIVLNITEKIQENLSL